VSSARSAPTSEASALDLTLRQRGVLTALTQGDNEKLIAVRFGISRSTVQEHVRRLFDRYAVSSKSELLVRSARRLRALDIAGGRDDDCLSAFQNRGVAPCG